MSVILLSTAIVALNCVGVQSSALLWQDEPTQFRMVLEAGDFSGSDGPFIWEFERKKISNDADGSQLLTATISGSPHASFSAKLVRDGGSNSLDWQILETTTKNGRSTLQAKGEATCNADNQVSTL